jgi:tripeptidyl-peptidase-1
MKTTFVIFTLVLIIVAVSAVINDSEERFFPEASLSMKLRSPPVEWKQLHKVNQVITQNVQQQLSAVNVTIVLRHRNREWLRDIVDRVSDPSSPLYGQHLAFAQINEMISPEPQHIQAVLSWLQAYKQYGVNVTYVAPAKDFIKASIPALVAQEMFQTELAVFKHEKSGRSTIRSLGQYSVPKKLSPAIAFVGNLIRFPKSRTAKRMATKANGAIPNGITPDVIRDYYNITTHPTKPFGKNAQAVASFLEQYYDQSDLEMFWNKYKIQHQEVKIIGPDPQRQAGLEAALDIEYITGVGEGIPTWFVSCPGLHEGQETFLEWIVNMTALGDASPYVHSVSYGDIEDSISIEYADRLDEQFQVFGASGRTVLIASGDNGSRCSKDGKKFVPEWPTSSPWVTSVGATQPGNVDKEETSTYWSGGGFSNYYATPKYQLEAIAQYQAQPNTPDKSFYNTSGRAYPDVSAFGVDFQVAYDGGWQSVGGTSASTPTFAGIVSLLNNARLSVGKKPLGFLNHVIYQQWGKTQGFKDIVKGRNGVGRCPGFPATPGWDPISGFGTPNTGYLIKLSQQL